MRAWVALLVLAAHVAFPAVAQQGACTPVDSLKAWRVLVNAYAHAESSDPSVYSAINEVYKAAEPISYLAPLVEEELQANRTIAMRDGEGVLGYLFEANLDQFFTLARGRNNRRGFLRGMRAGIAFHMTTRMTNDPSHPLLPGSWRIGAGGDVALWNSFRRQRIDDERDAILKEKAEVDRLRADATIGDSIREALVREARIRRWDHRESANGANWRAHGQGRMRHLYLSWALMHYSNGQPPGFFLYDADSTDRRNDWRKGDFSTNYFRISLNHAWLERAQLVTLGAGLRADLGDESSVFAYSAEQEHAFGRTRITALLQWRSRPYALPWPHVFREAVFDRGEGPCAYRLKEFWETRVRLELEHIADGDLSNYPFANKYRTSADLFIEFNPLRSQTAGFGFHFYYGRDYLNIRYDRAVIISSFFISFALDKFYPLGWHASQAIDRIVGPVKDLE